MGFGEGYGNRVHFPDHQFRNPLFVPIVLKEVHACTLEIWRCARRFTLLFELLRRLVAQRRVQPLLIVILLDELFDVRPQMLQVFVSASVNLLPLQGLDQDFAAPVGQSCQLHCIVIMVRRTLTLPTGDFPANVDGMIGDGGRRRAVSLALYRQRCPDPI